MNIFHKLFCAIFFSSITAKAETYNITGFAAYDNGTYGGETGLISVASDVYTIREILYDNLPRIIYVNGVIDLTRSFNGSPGVMLQVGSYKTLIGLNNAEIKGGGLMINNQKQVIIRNIKFTNALSYAPGERPNGSGGIINQRPGDFTEIDAITVQRSTHVWIDHNEFSDDPWIATEVRKGSKRHDGLVDIKRGSNYITVSNNIFKNHDKNMLIGHSDTNGEQDLGKLKVTLVGNWFNGTIQRNPRVRFGEVHVLNNLFTKVHMYGVGIGAGARIYSEGNVFEDCAVAYNHPNWISYNRGCVQSVDALLVNTVFGYVRCLTVDWNPSQYYNYNALNSSEVKGSVMRNAGIKPMTITSDV